MLPEQIIVLQKHYLDKYQDVFWVILRLGGIIIQSQLGRWLQNNEKDTTANTALLMKLEEAKLIKRKKLGYNNIVILTHSVSKYFGNQQVIKINGSKLKRSALIMEKYLRMGYYEKPPEALKTRMEKTGALLYLPMCEQDIVLLTKYIPLFEERGLCAMGLKNEIEILKKRHAYQFTDKTKPLNMDKNITDLYILECQNTFLSGIQFRQSQNGKEYPILFADIYNINSMQPLKLARQILAAKIALDVILGVRNMGISILTIYSHEKQNQKDMEIIYGYLYGKYSVDEEALKNQIRFRFFDTKATLFSNIEPSSIT